MAELKHVFRCVKHTHTHQRNGDLKQLNSTGNLHYRSLTLHYTQTHTIQMSIPVYTVLEIYIYTYALAIYTYICALHVYTWCVCLCVYIRTVCECMQRCVGVWWGDSCVTMDLKSPSVLPGRVHLVCEGWQTYHSLSLQITGLLIPCLMYVHTLCVVHLYILYVRTCGGCVGYVHSM